MTDTTFTIKGASQRDIPLDFLSATDTSSSLVIFVHGFKGFKDWGTHHLTARYFAQNGFNFLKFNFSHGGISEGSDTFDDLNAFSLNTFSKELFDLDQVITFASSGSAFPSPEKIYLVGHSLGGGISIIQTAEDNRVDKLVTWASVSNFRNLWSNEQEESWRKNGVLYIPNARTNQQMPLNIQLLDDLNQHTERLNVLNAARNINKPWLIIHGDADTSVEPGQAEELNRQHANSELLIIEGADHVFGGKHPWNDPELPPSLKKVCQATVSFFGRL